MPELRREPARWPSSVPERLILLGTFSWFVRLLLGKGETSDEGEHAHVAYLIGKLRLTPGRDFFQHHQPMLWDLLAPYYRLGGTGLGIFVYGRVLVVLCAIISVISLRTMSREWAGGRPMPLRGWGGVMLLAVLSCILSKVLVIRPEALSLALSFASFALWSLPARPQRDALAGALLGLAVYASPRFAIVAPLFAVLPGDGATWRFALGRLLRLGAGTVAAFFAYAFATGHSLHEIAYNSGFSALLQRVGPPAFLYLDRLGEAAFVGIMFMALLIVPSRWKEESALGAVLLGVTGLSVLGGWPHLYEQNFVTVVFCMTVAATRLESCFGIPTPTPFAVVSALFAFGVTLTMGVELASGDSLRERTALRAMLGETLRPGDTVILRAENHPVTAIDGSYYAIPLVDGPDRTCEAVRAGRRHWDLPACDYERDVLEQRPVLVDRHLVVFLKDKEEKQETNDEKDEAFLRAFDQEYARLTDLIYVRRDRKSDFAGLEMHAGL
jgi:hypothetical protein